ncbi:hypothetical protein J8F10_24250 [Gemmata sp. G18]|uniref:TMhelix containing protein n=1 Tax=Gemmata palustris TaxID=2822762 RepID=A0ABS5BXI5_9BACT|nr:hypothetical protein [Gemmata palustris]MBP3958373.1 hypothetical protein [Gemmata palustris]
MKMALIVSFFIGALLLSVLGLSLGAYLDGFKNGYQQLKMVCVEAKTKGYQLEQCEG